MPNPQLSEGERTELYWMARANDRGIGLYRPTVLKYGWLPEMDGLVAAGLAVKDYHHCGYWITDKGRAALSAALSPPSHRKT